MASVSRIPTSLGEVVRIAQMKHGVESGRQLQEVSRQRGIFISYTVLNELAAGTYRRALSPEKRERLSKLSGVPRRIVDDLAGAPPSAPMKLPEDDVATLTGDQRDVVLQIVKSFAKANRRADDAVTIAEAAIERNPGGAPPGESEEPDT
jgi:hypothetical protein